jgi:hypothetical protein
MHHNIGVLFFSRNRQEHCLFKERRIFTEMFDMNEGHAQTDKERHPTFDLFFYK